MSDDDSDGWLSQAVETGRDAAETITTALGLDVEAFVCPECGVACEPTTTYDPQRAAFDGGRSPAWACPECETEYVRETDEGVHTMDLYGRNK
jgi:predicted RNA-binding Zn-ribbon protein involved in translation (DUF1610 family)